MLRLNVVGSTGLTQTQPILRNVGYRAGGLTCPAAPQDMGSPYCTINMKRTMELIRFDQVSRPRRTPPPPSAATPNPTTHHRRQGRANHSLRPYSRYSPSIPLHFNFKSFHSPLKVFPKTYCLFLFAVIVGKQNTFLQRADIPLLATNPPPPQPPTKPFFMNLPGRDHNL